MGMDEKRIAQIWNEHSEGYDERHGAANKTAGFSRVLTERLGAEPREVLDLGTGTGFLALLLARLGHHCTGIDLAQNMLRTAERNARRQGLTVRFVQGSWDSLPFDGESFDAVVNRCVLWTLFDPARAFAEWVRVLRPGGRLLCFCVEDRGAIPSHYDEATEALLPLKKASPRQMAEAVEHSGFCDVQAIVLDGLPVSEFFPAWYLIEGKKQ